MHSSGEIRLQFKKENYELTAENPWHKLLTQGMTARCQTLAQRSLQKVHEGRAWLSAWLQGCKTTGINNEGVSFPM